MDTETIEYMLTIYSITLSVKFPCRMSLHADGKVLSMEVEARNNVFTFNQEIKIKVKSNEQTELSIFLSTGKSGHILAGIIPLTCSALDIREGENLTVGLQKCLDASATCLLKVNHSWKTKEKTHFPPAKSSASLAGLLKKPLDYNDSPQQKKFSKNNTYDLPDTFSQRHGYFVKSGGKRELWSPYYNPQVSKLELEKSKVRQKIIAPESSDDRDDEYIQLKTLNTRRRKHKSTVSETENNLKLDVLKNKTRAEQLEKSLNQKNKIIKDLKQQILELQRKRLEKQYVEQQLNNKQNTIRVLQDRVSAILSQNSILRQNLAQQQKVTTEIKNSKRFDLLKMKQEFEKKQNSLKAELNNFSSKFNEIQLENANKTTQLSKAKKYIQQLEKIGQDRIFQHEEAIQYLKKQQQLVLNEKNHRIDSLQQIIRNLKQKISHLNKQGNKLNENTNKKQNQIKRLQKKTAQLENENSDLVIIKNQYHYLLKKYNNLEETMKQKQKQYEKIIQQKVQYIKEIEEQNKSNTIAWQGKFNITYEKTKELKGKISELENQILQHKNEQQKLKKQIQKLQKNIHSLSIKHQSAEKIQSEANLKIQTLERNLQEKINEISHSQSILKMEIQHKSQESNNLIHEIESLESKYSKTCSVLDSIKTEKLRLESKLQLVEDNIQRMNQYIEEKKAQYETKQQDYKQQIEKLGGKIKELESSEKQKQKQLNSWEIIDLNNKNRIENLQKSEKNLLIKIQGFQKVLIPKFQDEKRSLKFELQEKKQLLKESEEQNKQILNERTKLQSETNKNTKINSVLNEEKLSIINQLNKLKNSLSRSEKKQETLKAEIKVLNEELKKSNLKVQMLQKQNSKNKEILSETVNTILNVINRGKRELKYVESKQTIIYDLSKSRFLSQQFQLEGMDIRRMSEIIQNSIKEQQNHIVALQDTNKQYKDIRDQLTNQLNTLSYEIKENEEKNRESIQALTQQLQETQTGAMASTQQYEEKIVKIQLENSRMQKNMRYEKDTNETLRIELEVLKKKLQITLYDYEGAQSRLKERVEELQTEVRFYEMNIKELEQSKKILDDKMFELNEEYNFLKGQLEKKGKHLKKMEMGSIKIIKECEDLKSLKKQLTEDLFSLNEEVVTIKQQLQKTKQILRDEEESKKKLQEFTNTLIKQKQVLVKGQLELTSKVYELESQLMEVNSNYSQSQHQLSEKEEIVTTNKIQIKDITTKIKDLEMNLASEKQKTSTLLRKIEGLQKKLGDTEKQRSQLEIKLEVVNQKMKKEVFSLKQELQEHIQTSQTQINEKQKKITSHEERIIELEQKITKKIEQISHFEETIFFEKQKSALLENTVHQRKKQSQKQRLLIQKLQQEKFQLSEDLGVKEEELYGYSGHLYQMEQKLEKKENESLIFLQKANSEWQNRHDEVCQQYEQKLEAFEKQKNYFKRKYEEVEMERNRLIKEIQTLEQQYLYKLDSLQQKEKEHETEKIFRIGEKSKELQHAKEQLLTLQSTIKCLKMDLKKKDHQIFIKEESIIKLEKKIQENEQITGQLQKSYQAELTDYKNKELGFKSYREELKNCQWSLERQSKKITQTFIQKVVTSFPQAKEKLHEPIRQLQQSMSSVINFKT